MMQKLVLASSNSGKLREFAELLAPLNFQLVPQADFAVPEADEPHATFIENALAKARHAARLTGLPALADDSGLVVPALGGAPGVHAARYAGEPKDDQRNNQKLVAALENIVDRRAHYVAVLALVRHVDDPQPLIGEGEWHGEIIATPRGKGGFGYDPHFFIPDLQRTAAELPADEKNRRSHRGQALLQLIAKLNHAA
ncbi:MAG: RdgB/HAM1 family non-canonical purine NTP pyrophosphatase [Pseudomonadota bacterium]